MMRFDFTALPLLNSVLQSGKLVLLSILKAMVGLPRWLKRLLVAATDTALIAGSVWIAFFLRLGTWMPWGWETRTVLLAAAGFALPIFILTGVYSAIFRYAGMGMIRTLARAFVIFSFAMVGLFMIYSIDGIPRTIAIIQPIVLFLSLIASRLFVRYLLIDLIAYFGFGGSIKNVLIYGAGRLGQQAASSLRSEAGIRVVGFIDDDERLAGQKLDGHRVFSTQDLNQLLTKMEVTDIVLALSSISRRRRREIIDLLDDHQVKVTTLPPAAEIVGGTISVNDIRPLEVEDLLGRQPVQPNELLMARTIVGKSVLVTGAGGSIGSELCRKIAANAPARLVMCDVSEAALYQIEREIGELLAGNGVDVVPALVSVNDRPAIEQLIQEHGVRTIFHAAAYKHVPLVEANVVAAVRNNVLGTYSVARAALSGGVSDMILVSTDKAVRPTNVMGATKRAAEQILQALAAAQSETCFSMVRFGNVLGSSGSVVPLFREQIHSGGPVTLTHRDILRYFMTIPEAASLVIQAGGLAKGGEVFVLDMGEPVRIFELAQTMIRLSGLSIRDAQHPEGDIEIVEIGLRPGEKLYEELLIGENAETSQHPQIMMAHERHLPLETLERLLERLTLEVSPAKAIDILREIVPEFDHRRDDLPTKNLAKIGQPT